jgi:hypothetical protein
MDKNHTKRKSAACTPRSRPETAAHLNENEAGSTHFQQFGNYSVALATPVTNCKLKEFKRIAMRADKTDLSFEAMINLTGAVINSR